MQETTATAAAPTPAPARAGLLDTLAVLAKVGLPTLAKGIFLRRPWVVAAAETLSIDGRAVGLLQRLRREHGPGPLLLPLPWRRMALVLEPMDVRQILERTPEPFSPATPEKRAALGHMEPEVSLLSEGPERTERRRFNEEVLEPGRPVHPMAGRFLKVIDAAVDEILADGRDSLDWETFLAAWHRAVRRIVLGDGAAGDVELTRMLMRLRGAANWAFLHPGRPRLRARLHARLDEHLARAEPGSLAERIAALPTGRTTAVADQVTHYLFAFEAGAMATYRALALLATHPGAAQTLREETADGNRPFGRACILDTLRLWPTTPAILRGTTREVPWRGGTLPDATSLLIFAPFFHRDGERLPEADRFAPELWLGDPPPAAAAPLVPFSGGPGICPAVHLVPMLCSRMLAALLAEREVRLDDPDRLAPDRPLPATLDHHSLRFDLGARVAA